MKIKYQFLRNSLLIGMVVLLQISAKSQNSKIDFKPINFSTALENAKKLNRYIFIDVATEWCGPCKKLDSEVFTNDSVATYFNSAFVNIKIDAEKGEGIEIKKNYKVSWYPTLLIINSDGNLVHRTSGFKTPDALINFGKDSYIPEKTFTYLDSFYKANYIDPKYVFKHLELRKYTLSNKDILENYFSSQSEQDKFNQVSWNIIRDYTDFYRNEFFQFLVKNEKQFAQLYSQDSVRVKIYDVVMSNFMDFDKKDHLKYRQEIAKLNFPSREYILYHMDMFLYQNENGNRLVKLALEKGDKYNDSEFHYTSYAGSIINHSNDKNALLKAEKWLKYAQVKWENEFMSRDWFNYTKVLYKLNKLSQAKTAALKTIETNKAEGLDLKKRFEPNDYKLLIKMANLKR
ncbi:thioredoxin family protein [Sediminibacterium sp.]|uniref:thioredoxin family protein n=1 Tax=Sediminibacterium sp. TaxID=1917865 RepID=UPI003F713C31